MKIKNLLCVGVFIVLTIAVSAADLFQAKVVFTNGKVQSGFSKFPIAFMSVKKQKNLLVQ